MIDKKERIVDEKERIVDESLKNFRKGLDLLIRQQIEEAYDSAMQEGTRELERVKYQSEQAMQVKERQLSTLQDKNFSLEQELKEKESIVDVIPILKKAILPFIEKVLNTIHKAEDENLAETFYIKSIKNSLNNFLMQSLNINGIEVVYSEAEKRGEKFAEQDAEIQPALTNDISKHDCLRRTLRPGVRLNGECIFNEKVEVWRCWQSPDEIQLAYAFDKEKEIRGEICFDDEVRFYVKVLEEIHKIVLCFKRQEDEFYHFLEEVDLNETGFSRYGKSEKIIYIEKHDDEIVVNALIDNCPVNLKRIDLK